MIVYNKLVRDRIPEIIQAAGQTCTVTVLNDDDYRQALTTKLHEELAEYAESHSIEELADLVELIYAIVHHQGASVDELEQVRVRKREHRGGFEQKLFLVSVDEA